MYANPSKHESECYGRCQRCFDHKLPCRGSAGAGRCINCQKSNVRCSGKVTWAEFNPCSICGQFIRDLRGRTRHYLKAHEKLCPGKCQSCIDLDTPCIFAAVNTSICSNCTARGSYTKLCSVYLYDQKKEKNASLPRKS